MVLRESRWLLRRRLLLAGAVLLSGCEAAMKDFRALFEDKAEPAESTAETRPAAEIGISLTDTIGRIGNLGDYTPMYLRGFSLVVGLGENGDTDCPTAIREYLTEFLTKHYLSDETQRSRPQFSAEELIDSPDSAVVEVIALVPPGAPKGARLDVRVQAVAGTQTRSLEGGLLLPCELRLFDVSASGKGLVAGQALARANGPVFTNPFERDDASGDLRRGIVLGGGRTLSERSVRLLLNEPSYALARRVERRINERFGQNPPASEAMSQGYVILHTPAAYTTSPQDFVQIAMHLYLRNEPAQSEKKLREVIEQLTLPGAKHDDLAMMCEGMGRSAISQLQPLYSNADPPTAFYACRTGLRLRDSSALANLAAMAASPTHAYRLEATREVGACGFPLAATHLRPLLDSDDQEVRIAAYDALLRLHDRSIQSRQFNSVLDPSQPAVFLDAVNCGGKPLIYARRTREPRIAVFGAKLPVNLPVFYNHPRETVTLNAVDGMSEITVLCRERQNRRVSERLSVPARVVDLIVALADLPRKDDGGRLRGIGLCYSQVIQVLDALCRDGTITARLALEQTSISDLLGPTGVPPGERRETDEPEREAPPGAESQPADEGATRGSNQDAPRREADPSPGGRGGG